MVTGRIHSIETCGTVDGPGVRFVIFTQGCPLRCKYCHNPDSWKFSDGKEISTDVLIDDIKKYKPYMRFSGGGVTASGGEPLMQPEFIKELFKRCKEENIHTSLDTSGYIDIDKSKEVLEFTDLVLLDIKSINGALYKNLTGVNLNPTLKFAKYLSDIQKPIWIRYVLVPNLTDKEEDIHDLCKFLSTLRNIEKIDILPFHKMGEYKWQELGYKYELSNTNSPSEESINKIRNIFREYNLETK